jgi:hypothetical protein
MPYPTDTPSRDAIRNQHVEDAIARATRQASMVGRTVACMNGEHEPCHGNKDISMCLCPCHG